MKKTIVNKALVSCLSSVALLTLSMTVNAANQFPGSKLVPTKNQIVVSCQLPQQNANDGDVVPISCDINPKSCFGKDDDDGDKQNPINGNTASLTLNQCLAVGGNILF